MSHSRGLLRVKVNPKIMLEKESISLKDIENLASSIDGIDRIKINKILSSATIYYNPNIIETDLWEDLINQNNSPKLQSVLSNLFK